MTRTQPRCPVCATANPQYMFDKVGVGYWACGQCQAVFSGDIDTRVLATHNDNPDGRCDPAIQRTRLQRICAQIERQPRRLLDFGCGRGDFLEFLRDYLIEASGVDQHTELQLPDIADGSVDVVTMVEVIEHLPRPLEILGQLKRILRPGGIIYVESSFADFIGDPAVSSYVDPRIGHCCIHSRRSIAFIGDRLDLATTWINNNVLTFRKQEKRPWFFGRRVPKPRHDHTNAPYVIARR